MKTVYLPQIMADKYLNHGTFTSELFHYPHLFFFVCIICPFKF